MRDKNELSEREKWDICAIVVEEAFKNLFSSLESVTVNLLFRDRNKPEDGQQQD
jgi:hypothetical protein